MIHGLVSNSQFFSKQTPLLHLAQLFKLFKRSEWPTACLFVLPVIVVVLRQEWSVSSISPIILFLLKLLLVTEII